MSRDETVDPYHGSFALAEVQRYSRNDVNGVSARVQVTSWQSVVFEQYGCRCPNQRPWKWSVTSTSCASGCPLHMAGVKVHC